MIRSLLMSGFDLHLVELPHGARVLQAPAPMTPLPDFRRSAAAALEEPVSGPPLSERVGPGARVAVAVDDFALPVPPAQRDCRAEMLAVVLEALARREVSPARISVVVANGLSRQWRPAELEDLLGRQEIPVLCHDAESPQHLARIGELDGAPLELNRALVDADLVVHLNVVTTPLMAGLFGLVSGTAGYRTARALAAPELFEVEAPQVPGSRHHAIHERAGEAPARRVPVFQLSAVLDNALIGTKLAGLLSPGPVLSRPLQVWNAIPPAVRHRAARLVRAAYRPFAAFAGPPEEVAPRALEAFRRQHQTTAEGSADVLLFGVPGVGPGSVGTQQDPILSASLALGQVANLFTEKPLLREGGVIVFSNPLSPQFDRAHAPHHEFYEKVLRLEREPVAIHEKFEPYFAGRPEFVSSYERRFAFHGTHPLYAWYQCTPARRRAGRIIAAYGDPRSCARLGFTPANDVDDALRKAREFLGQDAPATISVLQIPPPFWTRIE